MFFPWLALQVLGALALGGVAPTSAQLEERQPQWLWIAEQAGDDEDVFFLRDVDVDTGLVVATLEGSCDNSIELFLNGEQLAISGEWQVALRLDVTNRLRAGERNRLSINAWNEGGPAGLWLSLELEYESGERARLISDDSWWVSREVTEGWTARDFEPEGWSHPVELGPLGCEPWGLPLGTTDGKPPHALEASEIHVPDGFAVELVYNVPRTTQGSWVSLASLPGGQLVASDQYGGLYRITPSECGYGEQGTRVERIDVEIGEAQGLLWAFDALYVVGGTSGSGEAGLYRVTDSNADGELDTRELLQPLDGWGEHGPHAVLLGPDGESLYVVAGNHTSLPPLGASRVPELWDEDQLLPRLPDPRGHAVGVMAPGGWVCRTDPDGREWELFACGMRNAYDLAFNAAGDLFTFDSDMEWDVGLPWYRPTRVLQLVSGADYGWRNGSGKWPASYPDSWPGVVDVGLGSPTGVAFAPLSWAASLGSPWADSLLVADWAYGQIFAVELAADGSSYSGRVHEFLRGKPLPVTDLVVAGDVLYFTTGGRRVQSGLYRVWIPRSEQEAAQALASEIEARASGWFDSGLSTDRRALESAHREPEAVALDELWSELSSQDPFVQRAARVALEHRPHSQWQARALAESEPRALIQALIALARCAGGRLGEPGDASLAGRMNRRLLQLPFAELERVDKIAALRLRGLISVRFDEHEKNDRAIAQYLDPFFPSGDDGLDRELCRVLVSVEAPFVVQRGLALLDAARSQEERIFYFYALRSARRHWSDTQREAYFRALQLAIRDFEGGASLTQYLQEIRDDAVQALTQGQRIALSPYLVELEKPVTPPSRLRSFVRGWKPRDFVAQPAELEGRDLERGRRLLDEATCLSCHRFGGIGGNTGPDLAGAGNRFGLHDLLEAVLEPSAQISDQYQDTELLTRDDELFVGLLEGEDGELVLLRTLPPEDELLEFDRQEIATLRPHPLSRMPRGLLDAFAREEVLDLLAALLAGPVD